MVLSCSQDGVRSDGEGMRIGCDYTVSSWSQGESVLSVMTGARPRRPPFLRESFSLLKPRWRAYIQFKGEEHMMKLSLKDQLAVVTGAGSGIGYETGFGFAELGARLALVDIDRQRVESAADKCREVGCSCKAYVADVADFRALQDAFEQVWADFGEIEILVNSAGTWKYTSILEAPDEELDREMNVNLKGCVNTAKLVLPTMRQKRSGKIIFVASVAGKIGTSVGGTYYACSKGAVIALTHSLAREFGRFNINVNAVAPGLIDTQMSRSGSGTPQDFEKHVQLYSQTSVSFLLIAAWTLE